MKNKDLKKRGGLEPIEILQPKELMSREMEEPIRSKSFRNRVFSWHPCIFLVYALIFALSFLLGYLTA